MDQKTNIIVIMTDQQRADVRGLENYPLDVTPFLDSLATKGVWFNKAYTTMPVCTPARTSFLTGRWPSSHRVNGNYCANQVEYEKDLFDVAKEQGYDTALIGKNHTYLQPQEKLDYYFSLGHWGSNDANISDDEKAFDNWLKTLSQMSLEPSPFPLESQLPYRAVTAAENWVKERKDKPFLMLLSFPEPHNPYQVPEPYFSMFPPKTHPPLIANEEMRRKKGTKWIQYGEQIEYFMSDYKKLIPRARANYYGMLRLIDDQIQRFVQFLQAESMLDRTIILFVSDHGDFVGEYELIKKGPEAPDILARIPLQFYGPGIKASRAPHPAHVSMADIMPTLCDVMGGTIPIGVQGRSLWPMITGDEYPQQEFNSVVVEHGYGGLYHEYQKSDDVQSIGSIENGVIKFNELNKYTQSGWLRAVRKGAWKLNMDMYGKAELYHIETDPLELEDLYGQPQYHSIENELLHEMCTWLIRNQAPTLPVNKHYPLKQNPKNYLFQR